MRVFSSTVFNGGVVKIIYMYANFRTRAMSYSASISMWRLRNVDRQERRTLPGIPCNVQSNVWCMRTLLNQSFGSRKKSVKKWQRIKNVHLLIRTLRC